MNRRRPIFRESAMRHYLQRREQDVLPRNVSPPFFVLSWLILALLLVLALIAWSIEIPTYQTAQGVITRQGPSAASNNNDSEALIFFPAANAPHLHAGQSIQLQIGSTGPHLDSTISSVEPGVTSPTDARRRYALDNGAAQVIKEPSIVVIVLLDKSFPANTYTGTIVSVQIQVGSQQVLSQFI